MSGDPCRPFYPPHGQGLMQVLQATLADIDFEHEHERSKLSRARFADASLKAGLLAQIERRHLERREPYLRQLALLQQQHRPREPLAA
jgi:hypothetical protein